MPRLTVSTEYSLQARKVRRREKTRPASIESCALQLAFSRTFPDVLEWGDYSQAVAICRSAVPAAHRRHACLVFGIERQLRLRGQFVRRRLDLPAALSLWACALAQWRSFSSSPGFDPVLARDQAPVLVDCLLSVAAALTPYNVGETRLRADLRALHDCDAFDRICIALVSTL